MVSSELRWERLPQRPSADLCLPLHLNLKLAGPWRFSGVGMPSQVERGKDSASRFRLLFRYKFLCQTWLLRGVWELSNGGQQAFDTWSCVVTII